MTNPKTCRHMIGRTDEATGLWAYGYRCGKPTAPALAPGTSEYESGICLDHLNRQYWPLSSR
ncbi:hypothetical protein [Streptomyces sp. NPDC005281]|uniref:hypothetical protein n=1 Tax=Streptomyces sp. NPDC005281 TaxID=3155712 RepID=UPI0033A67F14